MSHWMKRALIVALVAVMAVGVIGTVSAQGPGSRGRGPAGQGMGMMGGGWFGPQAQVGVRLLDAVTETTGLTLAEVQAALSEGQTLAEILEANAVDPQEVIDTVVADVTVDIEDAVAAGTLTEEHAAFMQEELPLALDRMLNASRSTVAGLPFGAGIHLRAENSLLSVLAEMAGVDPAELVQDAVELPTLAEIAESYGLDPDEVIATAEARISAEINSLVEAGTLTEEQAALLLENLNEHLTERFNLPLFGMGFGMRGQFGPGMMDGFGVGPGGRNFGPRGRSFGRGMMGPRGMQGVGPGMMGGYGMYEYGRGMMDGFGMHEFGPGGFWGGFDVPETETETDSDMLQS